MTHGPVGPMIEDPELSFIQVLDLAGDRNARELLGCLMAHPEGLEPPTF